MDAPKYITPKSSGVSCGCLAGGCATVGLVMVLLMVGGGVATFYYAKAQIAKYTSDSPKALPKVEMSEVQLKEINAKIESFTSTLKNGETPEPIVLSAQEVNGLINEKEELRGRVFVRIENGQVSADVSFPLDAIPGAQGRYFNGSVSTKVSLENGDLCVYVVDADLNGQKVPEQFMSSIRNENLAKDVNRQPENSATLDKFESLVIDGDKIILIPKSKVGSDN